MKFRKQLILVYFFVLMIVSASRTFALEDAPMVYSSQGHEGLPGTIKWGKYDISKTGGYISGSYYLADDISLDTSLVIAKGYKLNLCLHGHSIQSRGSGFSAISILEGGELNLYDCQENNGIMRYFHLEDGLFYLKKSEYNWESEQSPLYGQLQGGVITGFADNPCIVAHGKFNLYSGAISANNNKNGNGAGVSIGKGGIFNMQGGTIAGNLSSGSGGGIFMGNHGNVVISGGEIRENLSMDNGGGISIIANSNSRVAHLTIDGGLIKGNATMGQGGGIYIDEKRIRDTAEAVLSGGVISQNISNGDGGGIYNNGSLKLASGLVKDNVSEGDGGGIYNKKMLNLEGSLEIINNYKAQEASLHRVDNHIDNNLFLSQGSTLGFSGELDKNSQVGLTFEAEEIGNMIDGTDFARYISKFFSDDAGLKIVFEDGEVKLTAKTETPGETPDGTPGETPEETPGEKPDGTEDGFQQHYYQSAAYSTVRPDRYQKTESIKMNGMLIREWLSSSTINKLFGFITGSFRL